MSSRQYDEKLARTLVLGPHCESLLSIMKRRMAPLRLERHGFVQVPNEWKLWPWAAIGLLIAIAVGAAVHRHRFGGRIPMTGIDTQRATGRRTGSSATCYRPAPARIPYR